MLQGIRDRAQGWIAWVIVGLIAIPFALWGIQEYFGVDPNIAVADVNGAEIPLSEFQISLQRRVQAFAERQLAPNDEQLKKDTIRRLVEDQLILQAGEKDGLRISDGMLAGAITTNPDFLVDGEFDQMTYDAFLMRAGFSPGRFEETLRQRMLTQQLEVAYAHSAIATKSEVRGLLRLQAQERRFAELIVYVDDHRTAEISSQAISEYYERNRARYVTDEKVQVQYVSLARGDLEAAIEADEDTLRGEYDNRIASFTISERRRVNHILIAVNDSLDDAAALSKAQALFEQIGAGADFGELARQNSDDPGSAEKGGDLGTIERGFMDPKVDQVAFTLKSGVLSKPIRSAFGYHLVKVTNVRPARVRTFQEARDEVLREYQRAQGEQLYFEQIEQLSNLAFEQPDNLDDAAEALGLELKKTDFFSRDGLTGHSLFSEPRLVEAAFASDVRVEGNNSDPIELDDEVVVLRVTEHRVSEQRSLAEVREEVKLVLERQAARAEAASVGKRLLVRLRGGSPPSSVEEENRLQWTGEQTTSRNSFSVSEQVRVTLFRMPHPATGESLYDGAIDDDGNFRILRLFEILEGDKPSDGYEPQMSMAQQGMAALSGRATFRAFIDALRAEASVDIFSERF